MTRFANGSRFAEDRRRRRCCTASALPPKAGGLAAFNKDPRGALIAELEKPGAGQIVNDDLLSVGEAARATYDFRQERKAARLARRAGDDADKAAAQCGQGSRQNPRWLRRPAPDMKPEMAKPEMAGRRRRTPGRSNSPACRSRSISRRPAPASTPRCNAEIGFAERLVWFWSNHFCVSADKGQVRSLCGAFEREAIRPHVTGKFADMLMAVETHPGDAVSISTMRARSARTRSPVSASGKGLNENLAREILELHTLGVRTGYSQADVTNFAKVITGWSVVPPKQPSMAASSPSIQRMHEPGAQRVIDRDYEDRRRAGPRGADAAGRHPATAKHVATKLARHFVADEPPQALVERLDQALPRHRRRSQGGRPRHW